MGEILKIKSNVRVKSESKCLSTVEIVKSVVCLSVNESLPRPCISTKCRATFYFKLKLVVCCRININNSVVFTTNAHRNSHGSVLPNLSVVRQWW